MINSGLNMFISHMPRIFVLFRFQPIPIMEVLPNCMHVYKHVAFYLFDFNSITHGSQTAKVT